MSIEMRKISDIDGFNPKEFCVTPQYWGYDMAYAFNFPQEFDEAKKLANEVDEICIAFIKDSSGEHVLVEPCHSGKLTKFILFNAKITQSRKAVRAVIFNNADSIFSKYWYDQRVKYFKDSTA